jgi:hypothetical protein
MMPKSQRGILSDCTDMHECSSLFVCSACICVCVCAFACLRVCLSVSVSVSMFVFVSVFASASVSEPVSCELCLSVFFSVSVSVSVSLCLSLCLCVCRAALDIGLGILGVSPSPLCSLRAKATLVFDRAALGCKMILGRINPWKRRLRGVCSLECLSKDDGGGGPRGKGKQGQT